MHEDRVAIQRDLDGQEKVSDRAPMRLGQKQCAAMPWGRQSPSSNTSGTGVSAGEKVPGPGRQPAEQGPAMHLIRNRGQQHLQQCEQSSALQQRWL